MTDASIIRNKKFNTIDDLLKVDHVKVSEGVYFLKNYIFPIAIGEKVFQKCCSYHFFEDNVRINMTEGDSHLAIGIYVTISNLKK